MESLGSAAITGFIFLFLVKEWRKKWEFPLLLTQLITIYKFKVVQNKKTVFLLLLKKLIL